MVRTFFVVVWLAATAVPAVAEDAAVTSLAPLPRTIPSPDSNPLTYAKSELGKQLFFDPRLSGDNTMSCATCHIPGKTFADGLTKSPGNGGKLLSRNTLGLANVGFFSNLFWDGRAASLEEQSLAPIQSPDEMHQNLGGLERELNAIPGYQRQFREVFDSPVTRDGIARALAAFQRTLVTQASPLDPNQARAG